MRRSGSNPRPGLDLPALTNAIQQHLESMFTDGRFSVRGKRFAGSRKVIAEVLDAGDDLSVDEAGRRFEIAVQDQIERFGFVRSNILQDYMRVSFYSEVRIGRAYRAALSTRREIDNPVPSTISLAAFKGAIKVGD